MLWDELGLGPSILASPGGVGPRNASSAPCPQHSSILSCCCCPVSLRVSSQSPSVVSCPVVLWVLGSKQRCLHRLLAALCPLPHLGFYPSSAWPSATAWPVTSPGSLLGHPPSN